MWGMFQSSVYGIVALTLERFLAVVYPVWHINHFTRNKIIAIIVCVWLIGICYSTSLAVATTKITSEGFCTTYRIYSSTRTKYFVSTVRFFADFIVPLSILSYFYGRMASALRRKVSHYPILNKKNSNDLNKIVQLEDMQLNKIVQLEDKQLNKIIQLEDKQLNKIVQLEDKQLNKIVQLEDMQLNKIVQHEDKQLNKIVQLEDKQLNKKVQLEDRQLDKIVQLEDKQLNEIPKMFRSISKARINIIKTLIIVDLGYVLCWSWNEFFVIIFQFGCTQLSFDSSFYKFTVVMVFLSSCINPLIYCSQYKQFQRGVKWVFSHHRIIPVG